jgi:hypothetical protein
MARPPAEGNWRSCPVGLTARGRRSDCRRAAGRGRPDRQISVTQNRRARQTANRIIRVPRQLQLGASLTVLEILYVAQKPEHSRTEPEERAASAGYTSSEKAGTPNTEGSCGESP